MTGNPAAAQSLTLFQQGVERANLAGICEPGDCVPIPARAPRGGFDRTSRIMYRLLDISGDYYARLPQTQQIDERFADWVNAITDPDAIFADVPSVPAQCDPGTCADGENPKDLTVQSGPAWVVIAIPDGAPFRFERSDPVLLRRQDGTVDTGSYGLGGTARCLDDLCQIAFFAARPGRGRNGVYTQPFELVVVQDGVRGTLDPTVRNPGPSDQ
ncbi:MAG: hypothetical protein AAF205_00730 [Pseudomonadota bacterium]